MYTNATYEHTMKRRVKTHFSLTDADIPGLRRRVLSKATTTSQEADRYGVGVETIRRAVRGETFRHIPDYLETDPLPGDRPPMATKHEVAAPPVAEAEESLKKFRDALDKETEAGDAVDKFLDIRKGRIDPTKGGE